MAGGYWSQEYAKINQLLHYVWGTIDYPEKNTHYKCRGTIRHNVLVAVYETKEESVIDCGSFTLRLDDLGRKLVGCYSWTDDATAGVRKDIYEWTKK